MSLPRKEALAGAARLYQPRDPNQGRRDPMSTALAVRKEDLEVALKVVAEGPVATVLQLQERIARLAPVANVLMPTISSPVIPAKMAVALSAVQIDVTTDQYGAGREVYFDRQFCDRDKDEVALGKVALLKILGAAGISVVDSRRLDNGADPHYVLWQVTLAGRDVTGLWIENPGTKELDYRDGAVALQKPEKVGDGKFKEKTGRMVQMDQSAIAGLRRNMLANAETKAILRAVRGFPGLALAQKYPRAVAARLWIIPRLVPALDPNDPADMQLAREQAVVPVRQLYGPRRSPAQLVAAPALPTAHHEPVLDVAPSLPAAWPTAPAPPQREPGEDDGPEDLSDLEMPDLTPPAPVEGELLVCACPCSCQAPISKELAAYSTERQGALRCRECYPGKDFVFEKHRDLRTLGLPKHPDLTADELQAALDRAGARK